MTSVSDFVLSVDQVTEAAAKNKIPVVVPRPGQSIDPAHLPKLERWWPDLPWDTAEDVPVISTGFMEEGALTAKPSVVTGALR